MWDNGGLSVAIPKRRGGGYLKVPYGHHPNKVLSDIETDEHCDMCGLDGYLTLEYRNPNTMDREAAVARVLPKLAKHFGFTTWREDNAAFWKVVMS